MDVVDQAILKKFTKETVDGAGAIKGDTGATGPTGPQGPQGIQGLQGENGSDGSNGVDGLQGPQGIQGVQGPKGDDGTSFALSKLYATSDEMTTDVNPVGNGLMVAVVSATNAKCYLRNSLFIPESGDTDSFAGYKYLLDLVASTVIRGPKGDTGEVGAQGPQGIQGLVGPQGIQGIQGIQGETGEQGAQGPKGDTGPKGDKGDTGAQGPSATINNTLTSTATDEALSANMGSELAKQINVLSTEQVKMFTTAIPQNIVDDATYKNAYVGTVIGITSMPNNGQWRIQYIPYFSYKEGYSVQMAYGCVGNSTIWYRKSHGVIWQSWQQIATTEILDISSFVVDGWTLQWGELKAFRSGNLVTIQCQLQNASTGALNIFSGLPVSIRPISQRMCNVQSCRVSTSNKTFYDVIIDTNGLIRIGSATPYSTANSYLNLLLSYPL